MFIFAQTNLQLFHQLQQYGYTEADLICVDKAYQLASHLFTGFFRGSGKAFIAHLVGTASILVTVNAPIEVVVGGLLHASYEFGDFGDGGRGITPQKQAKIRKIVGESIEHYIASYTKLKWQENNIIKIYQNIDQLDQHQKYVLLIRLANELEDHLDGGILYCSNAHQRIDYLNSCGHLMIEMANKIGYLQLAIHLNRVFQETFVLTISPALQSKDSYSYLLPTSPRIVRFIGQWRYRLLRRLKIILTQITSQSTQESPNF